MSVTEKIGKDILILTRSELYMKMRFMDVALSSFQYVEDASVTLAATDGTGIYYRTQGIGELFRKDPVNMNRLYLHMVLHCIFRHIIRRNGRDRMMWDVACDIVTESVIDGWNLTKIRKPRSWLRQETYRKLGEQYKVLTAERVYRYLEEQQLTEREWTRLAMEFTVDDHKYWPEDEEEERKSELNQKWQDISEEMQTDMETFSQEAASDAGHFLEQIQVENRTKYDYREFLRKFAVLKEEMQVDEDSFDYVFYTYGLELYGNMPLIEPQEWKEVSKVEEFVIVIDTSMSCSGELVRRFLEETYAILSENESFFRKVNIHIIQCDDQVQTDQRITNEKELKAYMDKLDLTGEGGTDFRPAFAYVEELMKDQEFSCLKGLIYFTDGQGIYPAKKPPFETAFVFLESEEETQVPPWAIRLTVEGEEFEQYGH